MIEFSKKRLKIIESPWSGWSKEQSKSTEKTIEVTQKNQLIPLAGNDYSLVVKNYSSEKVTCEVDNLGLKKGEDLKKKGIDLNACKSQEFEIEKNETIELYTCTMDSGTRWKITYY